MKQGKGAAGRSRPTGLELKILIHLWQSGNRGTVREILERWVEKPQPRYTTILTMLQIMEGKGLVRHEKAGRTYVYIAVLERDQLSRSWWEQMLHGMFHGDKVSLVNSMLSTVDLSEEEIRAVRKLLAARKRQ